MFIYSHKVQIKCLITLTAESRHHKQVIAAFEGRGRRFIQRSDDVDLAWIKSGLQVFWVPRPFPVSMPSEVCYSGCPDDAPLHHKQTIKD